MKTGMEILKEIRRLAVVEGQKAYSDPGGYSSGQASGLRVSGDLLEAWLREADKHVALRIVRAVPPALTPLRLDASNQAYGHVRDKLLGTTRTEGEK